MSKEHIHYLKRLKNKKRIIFIIQLSLIILFLTIWQLLASFNIINSFIFSSPLNIINTLIDLFNENNLFIHIFTTFKETLIAFMLGGLFGFIIALILYLSPFLYKVFDPFLTTINALPKIALGPLIIIWIGANPQAIIFMALLINVIVTIITIYNGFNKTDENKIKLLKSFKATKLQIIKKLIIPSSKESLISAAKLNISMSMIGVIMGEFLVSKAGLGYLIIYGKQVFNLDLVMTSILLLIIISYFLYKIIIIIEKKVKN